MKKHINKNFYDFIISNDKLNYWNLFKYGIRFFDLRKLIKDGVLEREKFMQYKFLDVNHLYQYGKKLLHEKNRCDAVKCFLKIHQISPKHQGTNFQLFIDNIIHNNFDDAYYYLDQISAPTSAYYQDYKTYLFLLSHLTKLSENHCEYIKSFEIDDILVDKNDYRFNNINIQNEVTYNIINCNFSNAFKLNNLKKSIKPYDYVLSKLLSKILIQEKKDFKFILDKLENDEYKELINFLQNEEKYHCLIPYQDGILELSMDILDMQEKNEIKECGKPSFDILGNIYNHNYEKAMDMLEKQKDRNSKMNLLYNLLKKCSLLKEKTIDHNLFFDDAIRDKVKEYLDSKLKILSSRNAVILLKPMSEGRINIALDLLKDMNNVIPRVIEINSKPTIFLKYQKESDEDYKSILHNMNYANRDKEYSKAIYYGMQVLLSSTKPKAFLFKDIGLLYLRCGGNKKSKEKAILYLEIANGVAKQEKNCAIDVSNLLFSLKNNTALKDTRFIDIQENDFYDDVHDSYGIDLLEDITAIIEEEKLSIGDACTRYNLNCEDTSIVKLIFARNNYCNRNFRYGDKLIKEVEREKDKTPFVKSLLDEIKTNKKLYPYRSKTYTKNK